VRKVLVAVAFFVALPLLLAQQTLNNDSVIKMVKMGFPVDMIVNAINRSPGTYDTSPAGLTALKNAGVGDKAVAAMVLKGKAPVPPTAPAQTMPASKVAPPGNHANSQQPRPASANPAGQAVSPEHNPDRTIPSANTQIAQSGDDTAKRIYTSSQGSVFLVYLNDSSGAPAALGSAFLVAPKTLVTNAHVVDAGDPVLAIGPVRVPLTIVRKDEKNDLAILSTSIDLTNQPLPLAKGQVSPGEEIFAIGNPEGLEKTISQGIVSGIRKREDRELLQITSPISHGSSGGPIINAKGEVVGVAVGMLEDGQNLNFAVPAVFVQSLLEAKADTRGPLPNLSQSIGEVNDLIRKRGQEDYSGDYSSQYQKDTRQLKNLVEGISASLPRGDVLAELACWGTTNVDLSDIGIKAARSIVKSDPSSDNRALLAYVLYDRAQDEGFASAFAANGSADETRARVAYDQYLTEAGNVAKDAIDHAKGTVSPVLDYVLGAVKDERNQLADAISLNTRLTNTRTELCGNDLTQNAIRSLIKETDRASKPAEAERWFRRYLTLYQPLPYEWDAEGDRRNANNDSRGAADAYERAAESLKSYGYDFCYASSARYYQVERDPNAVLSDGRHCIEASVAQTSKEDQKEFMNALPLVYRVMADVLEERGVYQEALGYVKESLSLKPDDPFALNTEAVLLEDLERYSECVSAEQSAIQASDGKYSWMHARLGNCYFDSQNWNQAAINFRLAAEADKTDAASAFNLALSLSRQGYTADADQWYREALTRNPESELRTKILAAIK